MDEAGRTAQQPLIMAPPALETDAEAEAPETTPLPAETVGRSNNGSAWSAAARAAAKPSEGSAESEAEDTPTGSNGRMPSFTPSKAVPTEEKAAPPAPAPEPEPAPEPASQAPPWGTSGTSEYTYPDPYQASGSSYSDTGYESPASSYLRRDWSPLGEETTTYSAPVAETGAAVNGAVAPEQAKEAAAAEASTGSGFSSSGGFSSVSNFSSAAATAVTGTAAGLLGSVTGAWRSRGANREPRQSRAQVRRPAKRQAMLTLARVEPWSVMKFSFVASVVAFVILFVAVAVLYMVLSALGVFDSIQSTVNTITGSKDTAGTNISHYFSASLILGYTAMLGALNIVLITAISTVGSVVYNLIAKTIGGIEVTLRETD